MLPQRIKGQMCGMDIAQLGMINLAVKSVPAIDKWAKSSANLRPRTFWNMNERKTFLFVDDQAKVLLCTHLISTDSKICGPTAIVVKV